MDIKKQLEEMLSDIFGMPIDDIDENTGLDNVPAWDSLSQLRIVLSIEEKFNVTLVPNEIVQLHDYKSILNIINKHLESQIQDS